MTKLRPYLFIFLLFSVSGSAQAGCLDWLLGQSPASQLRDRTADVESAIGAIEISDPTALKLTCFLGNGCTGTVVEAEHNGRVGALKLFTWKRPSAPVLQSRWENETASAIVIQQLLGEQGVAPAVFGILRGPALEKWLSLNHSAVEAALDKARADNMGDKDGEVRFALLMEKVEGITSKDIYKGYRDRPGLRKITRNQKADIMKQARRIDRILNQYRIVGDDFDVILREDGRLQLIDVSFYYLGSGLRGAVPRAVEAVTKHMLENKNLIRVEP